MTGVDPQFPPTAAHGLLRGPQIKEGNAPNRIYDWGLLDGSSINRVTQTMATHAVDSEGAGVWQISNIKYPQGRGDRTPSIR